MLRGGPRGRRLRQPGAAPAAARSPDRGRDAAFVTELVGGTLRGQGSYDAVIDHVAGRAPDPAVRDALRLGAHQLLAMRVPDHAAVTSTVELVRERVGHKPAGFTNALMRRIAERDLDDWMDLLDASQAVRFSHPQWIVDELARALDRPDELEALLAADNERPQVTLVARPGLSTVEELGGFDGSTGGVRQHFSAWGHAGVRRPRCDPGRPRRSRGCAGRRIPAGRAGSGARLGRGSRRALARPVRRSGREGGAARGPGEPSGVRGCWPTSASPTGRRWSPRRCEPRGATSCRR